MGRPSSGLAEWALLLAAVLHLWEVDSHGRAWVGYGAFFLLIVVVQAARPSVPDGCMSHAAVSRHLLIVPSVTAVNGARF